MAFVLLTINERFGTAVTKIAPMGMEPNSLSRILKSESKEPFTREKTQMTKGKFTSAYPNMEWN